MAAILLVDDDDKLRRVLTLRCCQHLTQNGLRDL